VLVKVEEKCSVLGREKNELQSRIEENDEELDELMKKYKAAIQQVDIHIQQVDIHIQQVDRYIQQVDIHIQQVGIRSTG